MNFLQGVIILAGVGLSTVTSEWSMIVSGILYRFAA